MEFHEIDPYIDAWKEFFEEIRRRTKKNKLIEIKKAKESELAQKSNQDKNEEVQEVKPSETKMSLYNKDAWNG